LLRDTTRAITELGIRVPEELHVIAHTNKDLPTIKPPFEIAQLEYDPEAHADAIGAMLLKLLRGETVSEPHVRLSYRLVAPQVPQFQDQGVSTTSTTSPFR
jgi:DNA-binding LacI/PurR family transcriptional regulator